MTRATTLSITARLRTLRPFPLALIAWAAGIVIVAGTADDPEVVQGRLVGKSTTGSLTQTNSKCSSQTVASSCGPIVQLSNAKPGGTGVTGTVTIKNTGSTAAFTLVQTNLVDSYRPSVTPPGPLSRKFQLLVQDITIASMPQTIYNGPVADFPSAGRSLGSWRNRDAHTYRFTVTPVWPRGGDDAVDNLYQGAQTSVTYEWKQR